jgi:hypothetical protein
MIWTTKPRSPSTHGCRSPRPTRRSVYDPSHPDHDALVGQMRRHLTEHVQNLRTAAASPTRMIPGSCPGKRRRATLRTKTLNTGGGAVMGQFEN